MKKHTVRTKSGNQYKVTEVDEMNNNKICPICGSSEHTWCTVYKEYICKDCLFVLPD